jgi:hypothetical protein
MKDPFAEDKRESVGGPSNKSNRCAHDRKESKRASELLRYKTQSGWCGLQRWQGWTKARSEHWHDE